MIITYYMLNGNPAICLASNVYYYDKSICIWITGETDVCLKASCEDEEYFKDIILNLSSDKQVSIQDKYRFDFIY